MSKKLLLAIGIAVSVGAAVLIALLAPAEKQLGDAVKLIYLHAGLVLVSMLLVTAVGALGLLYLLTGRGIFFAWAKPAKAVTLIFWFVYLTSSVIAMRLTWGGIIWNEPRLMLAASIFLVLIAIYLISMTFNAPRAIASLNLMMGVSVWVLVARVPAVMHPTSNPITSSSSNPIKLDTLFIFLFFMAAAILSIILTKQLTDD